MMEFSPRLLNVLLIEDNPGDVLLIREAFGPARMRVATDGLEASALLEAYRRGEHPKPDLILLDLNLPGRGGSEILEQVKSAAELRTIPVVILSSSDAQEEIAAAYARHANCYLVKPGTLDDYLAVVGAIRRFWGGYARLPGS